MALGGRAGSLLGKGMWARRNLRRALKKRRGNLGIGRLLRGEGLPRGPKI